MAGVIGRSRSWPPWRVPGAPWVRAAVGAAATGVLVVGGTVALEAGGPRPPDATGYLLLALAVAGTGLVAWSPPGALALTLAASFAYVGRGGADQGPLLVLVAVAVALYGAVRPERPWRSAVIGATALLGFHAAWVWSSGVPSPSALVATLVHQAGWVGLPLVLGHAVAGWRANAAGAEERARLAEQTREEHAQRRVAEERLRIARELHDVVSHTISVINLQAGVAAHVIDERPEQARQALLTIKAASKEALGELRGILGLLRQGQEAEPRAPAPDLDQLGALVEATARAGVPIRLSVDGTARRLPPAVELAAFRIVQESLANVLRHAGATSAAVTLSYQDDRLAVEVVDDGRGRRSNGSGWPPAGGGAAGLGITGMRERAAAVGGVLEVGPRPDGGFRVRARLPAPRGVSGAGETGDAP